MPVFRGKQASKRIRAGNRRMKGANHGVASTGAGECGTRTMGEYCHRESSRISGMSKVIVRGCEKLFRRDTRRMSRSYWKPMPVR